MKVAGFLEKEILFFLGVIPIVAYKMGAVHPTSVAKPEAVGRPKAIIK